MSERVSGTSDVCSGAEESAFAGYHCEDCLWMGVEFSEGGGDFFAHAVAEGV